MKPSRLFIILMFMTGTALAVVFLKMQTARGLHRIQATEAQLHEQRRELKMLDKDIAELTPPDKLEEVLKASEPGPIKPDVKPGPKRAAQPDDPDADGIPD